MPTHYTRGHALRLSLVQSGILEYKECQYKRSSMFAHRPDTTLNKDEMWRNSEFEFVYIPAVI